MEVEGGGFPKFDHAKNTLEDGEEGARTRKDQICIDDVVTEKSMRNQQNGMQHPRECQVGVETVLEEMF